MLEVLLGINQAEEVYTIFVDFIVPVPKTPVSQSVPLLLFLIFVEFIVCTTDNT